MSSNSARTGRVVVLSSDYPPTSRSGIGAAVESQVRGLADSGWEVVLLLATDQGTARVPECDHPRILAHALERRPWPAEVRNADCVHVHSLRLGALARQLSCQLARPLIYTVHGFAECELAELRGARDGGCYGGPRSGECEPTAMAVWSGFQRALIGAADRVVLLSQSELELAARIAPRCRGRFHVIGNSLPELPTPPVSDRRSGPIVFAGRWTRSKGVDLIGEIFCGADRFCGEVVLAGGRPDAAGRSRISQLRAQCGSRCTVAGWLGRSELDRLFRRAAAVLVPSRYEPFGLVALEAMRQGAPVLASDIGGLSEVVGAGSGGARLRSRDPLVWRDSIRRLRSDGERSETLQRRGPAFVRSRFAGPPLTRRLVEEVYRPQCA